MQHGIIQQSSERGCDSQYCVDFIMHLTLEENDCVRYHYHSDKLNAVAFQGIEQT